MVVMVDERPEHVLEMTAVEDQQPIEAFGADGAHEAFGDRVRLRGSHRCADDLDSLAVEDVVEIACELAVSVPDQEANRRRALGKSPSELARLLSDPGSLGFALQPARRTRRLLSSMRKST
jgi:hypothetical protein